MKINGELSSIKLTIDSIQLTKFMDRI